MRVGRGEHESDIARGVRLRSGSVRCIEWLGGIVVMIETHVSRLAWHSINMEEPPSMAIGVYEAVRIHEP